MKIKNLSNPPIKSVILGVSTQLIIDEINNQNLLNDLIKQYPVKHPTKSGQIVVGTDGVVNSKEELLGYCFESSDNNKRLYLEKYRIAFDNKGKYSNFDNFVNEFVELLAIIERNLEKKINATGDIGLRYINEFSLKFEDLGLFKISLNTGIKEIGLDFNAAYEVKNENVRSVVRVSRRVKNKDDVLIVFDIDSHMSCAGGEEVIGKFKHLRAEKNNIFFSNVNEKLIERWL